MSDDFAAAAFLRRVAIGSGMELANLAKSDDVKCV